jgi:glycosyltransferase involved in cell wall biosynthesis
MKVLHVIPAVAARYGGPSRAIIEMCRALQTQGVELLIAATDADGAGRLPVELGKVIEYQGVPTIFFSRQWSEAFKYSRPLAQWMNANVAAFDVAHLHAVFSHACLTAARACRRKRIPYIIRPLGTLAPWSLRQKAFRKQVMWNAGVRKMLRAAAALHYTTNEERHLVEDSLQLERGIVIPLPVEASESRPSDTATSCFNLPVELGEHPYVLVLSRLHPKKGLESLIRAFARLVRQKEFRGWRLALAGEGEPPYTAFLRQLAHEAGSNGNVMFTGWLEGEAKTVTLQNAALLALPSYQENFGLCVVEALACGVPVLVSPHVNLATEISAAGVGWVAQVDEASLGNVLAEIFRNAKERTRRGDAGRDFARRYLPDQIALELLKLYESITR